jgi:hypothetical protein
MRPFYLLHLTVLASFCFLTGLPAFADLGPAETEMKTTSFQAWCGKRKNDCTVSFEGERLLVNGKDGISRSQVIRIWSDQEMRNFWDRNPISFYQDVYYVTCKKNDGTEGTGRFIFLNHQVSTQFWNQLQVFLGTDRRDIGPSIKIEN